MKQVYCIALHRHAAIQHFILSIWVVENKYLQIKQQQSMTFKAQKLLDKEASVKLKILTKYITMEYTYCAWVYSSLVVK